MKVILLINKDFYVRIKTHKGTFIIKYNGVGKMRYWKYVKNSDKNLGNEQCASNDESFTVLDGEEQKIQGSDFTLEDDSQRSDSLEQTNPIRDNDYDDESDELEEDEYGEEDDYLTDWLDDDDWFDDDLDLYEDVEHDGDDTLEGEITQDESDSTGGGSSESSESDSLENGTSGVENSNSSNMGNDNNSLGDETTSSTTDSTQKTSKEFGTETTQSSSENGNQVNDGDGSDTGDTSLDVSDKNSNISSEILAQKPDNLDNTDNADLEPQEESSPSDSSSRDTTDETLEETFNGKGEDSTLELDEDELTEEEITDLKKKKLQELRDKLADYTKRKQEAEKKKVDKSTLTSEKDEFAESEEKQYDLSEQTNKFLDQLKELPSFENRERGAGYSIDTDSYTDVPDSVIRTLITKFLNQRFCKRSTDLNVRSNSLEKAKGFHRWEVKDVITHLETEQITKVLTDKYGYQYSEGKNESVPLSFYFDMSGSMSNYTNMLAVIAIELLKKNVKVLIGFNERVNVQIDSINGNIDVERLANILQSAGYYSGFYGMSSRNKFIKDDRVKFKFIDKNIDNYLIEKKCEKCVVFSDFDPRSEVINLSQKAQTYWFCFENDFRKCDLSGFRGFVYPVQNVFDLANGLIKVNNKRFETLCFTDNPKILQKRYDI